MSVLVCRGCSPPKSVLAAAVLAALSLATPSSSREAARAPSAAAAEAPARAAGWPQCESNMKLIEIELECNILNNMKK